MAKIKDLDLIKNSNSLLYNQIIVYGAGNYGKLALKRLEQAGFSVSYVCDSAVEKWGEKLEGRVEIISPMELNVLRKGNDFTIIIAINSIQYVKQVLKMLDYCGMKEVICYTYFALNYALSFQSSNFFSPELNEKEEKYVTSLLVELYCKGVSYNTLYNLITNNTILVYQPAKVGSYTVYTSFLKNGIMAEHIHFLNGSWFKSFCLNNIDIDLNQRQQEREIFRGLKKVKIITMVREPIGRDISHFFQILNYGLSVKDKYHVPDILTAITTFLDEYSNFEDFGYQFEWFNHEIKEVFGVDIYKYGFNKERGYEIIHEKNVEILIMKMENLDQYEEIIGQFVGLKNFKMERVNSGSDKLYHFAYQEIKEQIHIPQEIIDRYYKNNVAMDYFYTNKEKAAFLKYWGKEL